MIRFVNIETKELWQFDDWNQIISLGGLWKVLPSDQKKFIYNEGAVLEQFRLCWPNISPNDYCLRAYQLFIS